MTKHEALIEYVFVRFRVLLKNLLGGYTIPYVGIFLDNVVKLKDKVTIDISTYPHFVVTYFVTDCSVLLNEIRL